MMPETLAMALRADGWYLRSRIILAKVNPMPESVRDRPTKSHEHLFLLSKNQNYYYDQEAALEPVSGGAHARIPRDKTHKGVTACRMQEATREVGVGAHARPRKAASNAVAAPAIVEPAIKAGCPAGGTVLDPFGGAGTSALVAERLGRNAILIELNDAYAEMARARLHDDAPLFAQTEIA